MMRLLTCQKLTNAHKWSRSCDYNDSILISDFDSPTQTFLDRLSIGVRAKIYFVVPFLGL